MSIKENIMEYHNYIKSNSRKKFIHIKKNKLGRNEPAFKINYTLKDYIISKLGPNIQEKKKIKVKNYNINSITPKENFIIEKKNKKTLSKSKPTSLKNIIIKNSNNFTYNNHKNEIFDKIKEKLPTKNIIDNDSFSNNIFYSNLKGSPNTKPSKEQKYHSKDNSKDCLFYISNYNNKNSIKKIYGDSTSSTCFSLNENNQLIENFINYTASCKKNNKHENFFNSNTPNKGKESIKREKTLFENRHSCLPSNCEDKRKRSLSLKNKTVIGTKNNHKLIEKKINKKIRQGKKKNSKSCNTKINIKISNKKEEDTNSIKKNRNVCSKMKKISQKKLKETLTNLANENCSLKLELKDTYNQISVLKNRLEELVIDEPFKENECPTPMPYVTKYSNNSDFFDGPIVNKRKEGKNNRINKYFEEPKEEKIIPLPISSLSYIDIKKVI